MTGFNESVLGDLRNKLSPKELEDLSCLRRGIVLAKRHYAAVDRLKAKYANMIVVDGLDMGEIKTKTFAGFLKSVESTGKALVVTPEVRKNIVKSAANIPGVRTTIASTLNVYDILNADMFIMDKDAVQKLEEVYA